ncbi:FTR1 family protein [Rhizobium sp. ARZ01]|uniref:FTR1 family iron permease n=1 Tax=Rhizobium sp. ARZ01 TaxID=2769313 RepID=UPI001AEE3176|nr:FTR1 family protein [Rhizobium sp. ARZ01]
MSGNMIQIFVVVWRESIEALLVIGILSAWLMRQPVPARKKGQSYLRAGVLVGLLLALMIASVILFVDEWLDGDRQDYFQATMVFVAAALIMQMVFWMRSHGRQIQQTLENSAGKALAAANGWGLLLLAALAIAREGSETAVFLYGILASSNGSIGLDAIVAMALGFGAALGCYLLLQVGARALTWKVFFRLSEIMLLILAGSLLMSGVDKLIGLDLLPPLSPPLWNTAWLLDDGHGIGSLIASLTGYRARPELLPLMVFAGYWLAAVLLLGGWKSRRAAVAS